MVGRIVLFVTTFGLAYCQREVRKNETAPIDCAVYGNGHYVFGCNSTYWVCHNLFTYEFKCYGDLALDPDTDKCDYRENVRLCNHQRLPQDVPYRALNLFTCADKHDGLYSSGYCDSFFYSCNNGTRDAQLCPHGQFFDFMTLRCDLKENVFECQEENLQPRPIATPAIPKRTWNHPATAVPPVFRPQETVPPQAPEVETPQPRVPEVEPMPQVAPQVQPGPQIQSGPQPQTLPRRPIVVQSRPSNTV